MVRATCLAIKPRSGVLPAVTLEPTKLSVTIRAYDVAILSSETPWIFSRTEYRNGFCLSFDAFPTGDDGTALSMKLRFSSMDMKGALGITWSDDRGAAVRYSWTTPAYPGKPAIHNATLMGKAGSDPFVNCLNRSCPTVEEVLSPYTANGRVLLELSAEIIDVQ